METLERLQRQLDTGDDLTAVVRATKALAVTSIQQYERAVHTLSTYARTVELGLHVVLRERQRRAPAPSRGTAALIVLGSDHGLCGRFNDDVAALAIDTVRPVRPARVLAVGARTATALELAGLAPEGVLPLPASAARITQLVRQLLVQVDAWRTSGVGDVRLVFNAHLGRTRHASQVRTLLPLDFTRVGVLDSDRWPAQSRPMRLLPEKTVLAALIRQHLFVELFRACAESLASEHGARLVAMQAAEQNLRERQAELTRRFRHRRQERITAELLDVIAGYEALTTDA